LAFLSHLSVGALGCSKCRNRQIFTVRKPRLTVSVAEILRWERWCLSQAGPLSCGLHFLRQRASDVEARLREVAPARRSRETMVFAQALARVIAHELVHAIAPEAPHATAGSHEVSTHAKRPEGDSRPSPLGREQEGLCRRSPPRCCAGADRSVKPTARSFRSERRFAPSGAPVPLRDVTRPALSGEQAERHKNQSSSPSCDPLAIFLRRRPFLPGPASSTKHS
jgi:hypothetical protein